MGSEHNPWKYAGLPLGLPTNARPTRAESFLCVSVHIDTLTKMCMALKKIFLKYFLHKFLEERKRAEKLTEWQHWEGG